MDEMERLRTELWLARNRVSEMEQQLQLVSDQLREYADRLTLSAQERSLLAGREDGCVRVHELEPLLRRVFRDAA